MNEEIIHMAGPWITEHETRMVEDAVRNGWYENAYSYCEKFQNEFAKYHGRKHALMTPNCTTAIHLLLAGLGIEDGAEVIVPECTWIASAAPITYQRATPVFCDIDEDDWCLSPESVESRITPKTRAMIVVDIFGNMPKMEKFEAIAKKHGIAFIEDAAESLGSVYHGKRAGGVGIASVFSFHRTKTITTGEGGMLLLDDDELYERCAFLRDHGRKKGGPMYYNYEVTFKYMPFNVQAALGYAQFQRLDQLVQRKRQIFHRYRELLADIPDLQFNPEPEGVINGAWITGLVFGKRYKLSKHEAIERLGAIGIPARPFFYPLSSLPAYEGSITDKNPVAYDLCDRGINLPGAFSVTDEQIGKVCNGIRTILKDRG